MHISNTATGFPSKRWLKIHLPIFGRIGMRLAFIGFVLWFGFTITPQIEGIAMQILALTSSLVLVLLLLRSLAFFLMEVLLESLSRARDIGDMS